MKLAVEETPYLSEIIRKDSLFPPFFVALILKKMKDNCRIDTFSKFEIQIAHSNQNTTLTTDHYFG